MWPFNKTVSYRELNHCYHLLLHMYLAHLGLNIILEWLFRNISRLHYCGLFCKTDIGNDLGPVRSSWSRYTYRAHWNYLVQLLVAQLLVVHLSQVFHLKQYQVLAGQNQVSQKMVVVYWRSLDGYHETLEVVRNFDCSSLNIESMWVDKALYVQPVWMLYVNNEFECFIRGSKHEKTVWNTSAKRECFIVFECLVPRWNELFT
jgi:hypothetical protein